MGKKKNKKKPQQQQPAFRQRPIMVVQRYSLNQQNKTIIQVPTVNTFQAPHHQQESMVELSDDTSPNTPLATSTGGWKPLQAAATTTQAAPTEIKITRQEEIWREFKDSLNTKPIYKIGEKKKPDEPTPVVLKTNKPAETKKSQTNEIKWELNELDDKDVTPPGQPEKQDSTSEPQPSNLPKPIVTQGTASEIKLFTKKDKQGISQTTSSKQEIQNSSQIPGQTKSNTSVSATPSTSNIIPIVPKEPSQPRQAAKNVRKEQSQARSVIDRMYMSGAYPKGIPRSFLVQQTNKGSIEPQGTVPYPNWNPNLYDEPGLQINTDQLAENPLEAQQYSPSEAYEESGQSEQAPNGSESPDGQGGQKRLSAFHRLGPVSQPKKPKLTINLLCSKDESVREVLEDEIEETYTPVHLRKDVIESSDETVIKYLPFWPWKRNVTIRKSVTSRNSKSVMILEQEQMEEVYERDNLFVQVSVRRYPRFWKKEHVLDVVLDSVKGKSFIPCFIEFTPDECKFLVIRCRSALIALHKLGFYIRKDDVELRVTISHVDMSLSQIDFIPRLVLRKQLAAGYDGERKLSLKEFTLKSDISHFIYFPLNRITNQTELVQLQSTVAWDFLTDLDLSHNRLTSIDGFELPKTTPKLKHLDLSYNWFDKVTSLLHNRELSLRSLKLEGNPLCHDYIDPGHYVRVIKMIFRTLTEIDGVPIHLKGDLPPPKRNYCPSDAIPVASKFLEVFFPLLETSFDERGRIEEMYDEKAVLTVTYRNSLRYSSLHRKFRNIFLRARVFDEGETESIEGAAAISRLICKWPMLQHDPYTFTVDVIHHGEYSTILRVCGVLKLTSETLAEDEHLLAFTRTLVLTTLDGVEYKILNEMVYWDEPSRELANTAFQINTIRIRKRLSLKLDSTPDDDLKEKLTEVFMSVTELDKKCSERCLALKDWNLKSAIEYFMKLVKLDDLNTLRKDLEMDKDSK